jgi:SAM-dependent methyltransferase
MPSEEQLAPLYDTAYSAASLAVGAPGMISPARAARGHTAFIARLCPPGGRVLDFGAGTGALAHSLRERGFLVTGVEASEDAVADARRRYGIDLHRNLAEIEPEAHGAFDLVACVEVIEHLTDPRPILTSFARLLRPGGWLYLATPNRNGLLARAQRCRWREARDPCHLMLYNYRSLSTVLRAARFEDMRYVRFSPLTVASWPRAVLHRALQVVGLYGGLRVVARAPSSGPAQRSDPGRFIPVADLPDGTRSERPLRLRASRGRAPSDQIRV